MMFKRRFHSGIIDGSVTRTFRYWKRPQAVKGNFYKINPIGHIRVTSVAVVTTQDICARDARVSGFRDRKELIDYLSDFEARDRELYRVNFKYEGQRDDQEPDRSSTTSSDEVDKLVKQLSRKDQNSRSGPWTTATLELIGKNPGLSSAHLAKQLDRERAELKRDVRKLKQLGLTISLEVGYKLSDRGSSYLRHLRTLRRRNA